jgi:hypothetical protein
LFIEPRLDINVRSGRAVLVVLWAARNLYYKCKPFAEMEGFAAGAAIINGNFGARFVFWGCSVFSEQ